jgi:hypothetical protein
MQGFGGLGLVQDCHEDELPGGQCSSGSAGAAAVAVF